MILQEGRTSNWINITITSWWIKTVWLMIDDQLSNQKANIRQTMCHDVPYMLQIIDDSWYSETAINHSMVNRESCWLLSDSWLKFAVLGCSFYCYHPGLCFVVALMLHWCCIDAALMFIDAAWTFLLQLFLLLFLLLLWNIVAIDDGNLLVLASFLDITTTISSLLLWIMVIIPWN